jgi:hypothetical protein
MKKVITLALVLVSTLGFSQLTKVEIEKPIKEVKVSRFGSTTKSEQMVDGTTYLIYQDAEFTKISKIESIVLSKEDFDSLGNLLVSNDTKEEDFYTLTDLLGNKLSLIAVKSAGKIYFSITVKHRDGGTSTFPYLNKKDLAKLFFKEQPVIVTTRKATENLTQNTDLSLLFE